MVIIQTYAARDSPQWNILIADKRKKNRMNCVKSQNKKGERNEINEDSMHTYASGSFHDSKSWLRGRNI